MLQGTVDEGKNGLKSRKEKSRNEVGRGCVFHAPLLHTPYRGRLQQEIIKKSPQIDRRYEYYA